MQKLLTGFAAAAAVSLMASAAQADCGWHQSQVTASTQQVEQGVAMSTYDGATPPIAEDAETAATQCPEGATDCAPAGE